MKIILKEFLATEKETLKKNLLFYFQEIAPDKINKQGKLDYPYLNQYWTDDKRLALKIASSDKLLGFVLINDYVINQKFKATKSIAEFYIKPTFRRRGIGKNVAFQIFNKYKEKWEVRQSLSNLKAQQFWRTIIGEYTQNYFEEIVFEEGLLQIFTTE